MLRPRQTWLSAQTGSLLALRHVGPGSHHPLSVGSDAGGRFYGRGDHRLLDLSPVIARPDRAGLRLRDGPAGFQVADVLNMTSFCRVDAHAVAGPANV